VAKTPSDPFDPCREWLGIDRADLADPRRVLGLLPSEADPIIVLRASEARLSLLKGLAAGPHHAAREALILRVEQARESVLSQIAASGGAGNPQARESGSGFAMPPPPRRPGHSETDDRAEEGATVLFAGTSGDPSADGHAVAAPAVRIRTHRPIRRRDNSAGIWFSILAMLASAAAFGGFIWWQARQQERRLAAKEPAKGGVDDEAGRISSDRKVTERAKPLPEDMAISSSPPPSAALRPRAEPKPGGRDSEPPRTNRTTRTSTDTTDRDTVGDAGPPTDPLTVEAPMASLRPTPDPADADVPVDPAGELVGAPRAGGDDPGGGEEPPAGDRPVDAPVEAEIAASLRALREDDFDTADALLASALEGAEGIPAKQRIADWKVLADYAREFAGFREKALQAVKAGDEFDVNGKKVAVVEIDAKKLIYRFQGRNKTVPRDKIPAGIVMAIVTTWFDERPANNLFLGAYHATKPEADLAKAKSHWELAEKGGINATPLLGLLDDPVLVGAPAGKSTRAADE
jgi:hypothetical protein